MDSSSVRVRTELGASQSQYGGVASTRPTQERQDGLIEAAIGELAAARELHARLVTLNYALRGAVPCDPEAPVNGKAPEVRDLRSVLADLHRAIKSCHLEINESQVVLGI